MVVGHISDGCTDLLVTVLGSVSIGFFKDWTVLPHIFIVLQGKEGQMVAHEG